MALSDDLEAATRVDISTSRKPHITDNPEKNRNERSETIHQRFLRAMQTSEMRQRLPILQDSPNVAENAEHSTLSGIELNSCIERELRPETSPQLSWIPASIGRLRERIKLMIVCPSKEGKSKGLGHKSNIPAFEDKNVDDFPRGFPRLAALLSSHDNLMIFRSFRRAHIRILLKMEVEITQLISAWDKLDEGDTADPNMWYRIFTTEDDKEWDPAQREMLEQVKAKLIAYDQLLLYNSEIQALGRPPDRDHESFYNWITTEEELSPSEYQEFVLHESDFVSGIGRAGLNHRPEMNNPIEESIRSYLAKHPNSLITWLFKLKTEARRSDGATIEIHSPYMLRFVDRMAVVTLSAGMVLIPVFLLLLLSMTRVQMALVVLVFVMLFGVVITATDAAMTEIFVAMAAYAAVLVTFLGNLSGT